MSRKSKKGEGMVTVATRGGVGEQSKHRMHIDHSPWYHLGYAQPD